MPSLQFHSLPLVQVNCDLVFTQPIEVNYHTVEGLREALRDDAPTVADCMVPGPLSSFPLIVGRPPGATFENRNTGLAVQVLPDRLLVQWSRGEDRSYLRYARLRESINLGMQALAEPAIRVANMLYVNSFPASEGHPQDYLQPEVFPVFPEGHTLIELNHACTVPTGEDFRIQIGQGPENFFIATACGVEAEGHWAESLDRVHDRLQVIFGKLISAKAKKQWQLQLI